MQVLIRKFQRINLYLNLKIKKKSISIPKFGIGAASQRTLEGKIVKTRQVICPSFPGVAKRCIL